MALTKAQIIAEIDSLLASGSSITAAEHREALTNLVDKVYEQDASYSAALATIDFTQSKTFGTPDEPITSATITITVDTDTALEHYSALIYHKAETEPTFNTTGVTVEQISGEYTETTPTATLNRMLLTYSGNGFAMLTYLEPAASGTGDMEATTYDPANKAEQVLTISDSSDFATAAQGALADTALQPADVGTAAAADTTDFATAAQGALADSAQQPPSEGAFVDGDKTKLDGIATGAEVNTIESVTAGEPTGSDQVLNVVSLTTAEYGAGSPVATTLYIITDA